MNSENLHEYQGQQHRLKNQQNAEIAKQDQKGTFNLNNAIIRDDQSSVSWHLEDYSTVGSDGKTLVFFKNLEDRLIRLVRQADIVLGCVAWVTSELILKALAEKKGVSLIVQKEDFLRPDLMPSDNWSRRLRQLYESLPKRLDRRDFPGLLSVLTVETDSFIDPVRCVGNYNIDKQPACPRSHHKFVLFCRGVEHCVCKECQERLSFEIEYFDDAEYEDHLMHIHPYAVWTGSFNFTKNAVMSFENAVILYDPKIVDAFYHEYVQVAVLSEPLDWKTPWTKREGHVQMPCT